MTAIYSLSESTRIADAQIVSFRRLLAFVLAAEALFGLWLLLASIFGWPTGIDAIGVSPMLTGAFLLWAVLFQVPGFFDPVRNRLPVVIGVIGRYGIGIAALFLKLWLCALVLFGLGLALNIVYHKTVRLIVMSRP